MPALPLSLENKRTHFERVVIYTRERLAEFEALQAENEAEIAQFLKPYETLTVNPHGLPVALPTTFQANYK